MSLSETNKRGLFGFERQGSLGCPDRKCFNKVFYVVNSQEILELSAGAEEGIGLWKKEGRVEGATVAAGLAGGERNSL